MTRDEFNNTGFTCTMRILYKRKIYPLAGADFEHGLIAFADYFQGRPYKYKWIRCEKCKIKEDK